MPALEQLVNQPHGMLDSCMALKNLDAVAGGKMFDATYRILYKTSLDGKGMADNNTIAGDDQFRKKGISNATADWSLRNILLLRRTALIFLIHSPAYTFALWNDHVLKFGAAFEKNVKGPLGKSA